MDAPPVTPASPAKPVTPDVATSSQPRHLSSRSRPAPFQRSIDWLERTLAAAIAAGLVAMACAPFAASREPGGIDAQASMAKIEFSLEAIDERGLTGPPDGLRAVSYEFCLPDDAAKIAEVRSIDRTVEVMRGAKGRVGCGDSTVLCVGSTHQAEWRDVLGRVSSLSYVDRVARADFE